MVLKEGYDGGGAQMGVSRVQSGRQLLRGVLGVLHGLDQHRDALLSRGQPDGCSGHTPERFLARRQGWVGGEIDVESLTFFTLQRRVLMELPEEGARIQAQPLSQLKRSESAGRLADQGNDGLREVAVARETDVAMEPKTQLIKLRQFGQGIEAAVVVEAGQSAPGLESTSKGSDPSCGAPA